MTFHKIVLLILFFQGMVEAGLLKPITFTWTPPQGHDVSSNLLDSQNNIFYCMRVTKAHTSQPIHAVFTEYLV